MLARGDLYLFGLFSFCRCLSVTKVIIVSSCLQKA